MGVNFVMQQKTFDQILSGLWWGLLWTVVIVFVMFLVFPIFSIPIIIGIALICTSVGVFFKLRVNEQLCPECHTVVKVMPTGSKCPKCGFLIKKN